MYFVAAGSNGDVWRCNGRINNQSGQRCCNGTMRAATTDSFFYNRNISNRKILQVLYFWLYRLRKGAISEMLRLNPKTVQKILQDWYEVIHEDLTWGDVKIGKFCNSFDSKVI